MHLVANPEAVPKTEGVLFALLTYVNVLQRTFSYLPRHCQVIRALHIRLPISGL